MEEVQQVQRKRGPKDSDRDLADLQLLAGAFGPISWLAVPVQGCFPLFSNVGQKNGVFCDVLRLWSGTRNPLRHAICQGVQLLESLTGSVIHQAAMLFALMIPAATERLSESPQKLSSRGKREHFFSGWV